MSSFSELKTPEKIPQKAHMNLSSETSLTKALVAARAAIDKKAERVRILDLTRMAGFTDYFVVCSGASDRQAMTIADNIEFELRTLGYRAVAQEGYSEGRWVLTDFGDVVVHVFQDTLRDYYDLEGLWQDAPQVPVPSEFYGAGVSREN